MDCQIWSWKRGFLKVYVEGLKLKRKISQWKEVELRSLYYYPNKTRAWDFVVPIKLKKRVMALINDLRQA